MVEVGDKLEGPNPTERGNEEERVVYPTCGEIFKEAGHKIVIRAFTTQQSAPTTEEVAEKEDAVTQEPSSLNILAEVATNSRTEEPRDEVIPDCGDEYCTMTPEPSLNVLVQVSDQMGGEPGIEGTLEFNKGLYTTTSELSHDTEIIEEKPQHQ